MPLDAPRRIDVTRDEIAPGIWPARLHDAPWREMGDAMGPISPSAVRMASTRAGHKLSRHSALRQQIEHIVAEFGAAGENIEA